MYMDELQLLRTSHLVYIGDWTWLRPVFMLVSIHYDTFSTGLWLLVINWKWTKMIRVE